jgi:light-regulated signal transduction histidine kinase (bacteriophytochrome)
VTRDSEPVISVREPIDGAAHARAMMNILDDFGSERDRLADTQRAILNILEDAAAERTRLQETQKAMLNILDDLDFDYEGEKQKVERVNEALVNENRERRLTAQALTERSLELARSNADLEQFAYVASHDLQEPLRMVSSYVQLLERRYGGQLDPQADKYIAYAVDGARRMQGLIAGLLEYSRVDLDDARRRPVLVSTALDQSLENLRTAIDESGTVVERGPLPLVLADSTQLAQVLQNLVANAIKFRRDGDSRIITVTAEHRGREAIVSVSDHGIGLEPQYAERIFMIFQRLHTRSEYPGTGIGLAICKKVVERHGGRIWVEPTDGGGATFRFTLPLAPMAAAGDL